MIESASIRLKGVLSASKIALEFPRT